MPAYVPTFAPFQIQKRIPIKPARTLQERLETLTTADTFKELDEPGDPLTIYFPTQPPTDFLHILVQRSGLQLHEGSPKSDLPSISHDKLLKSIHPNLQKFVEDRMQLPSWQAHGDCDDSWREHVKELHIPTHNNQPSLLLHGIGDPKWHQHDFRVLQRVKGIFTPGQHK